MSWDIYSIYIYFIFPMWILGTVMLYTRSNNKNILADILINGGILLLMIFTVQLWIGLGRPPFRTLAETRLWYGVFLSLMGVILFYRWKFKWILTYSLSMASLFLLLNYFRPDTFDQTLMPALQSPWFVPHVIVYILAYAILSGATLISADGILALWRGNSIGKRLVFADNLVYIGFAFLTFGLLFGALWAKEAWGHYWTWDPKETWALISWMIYLLFIHYRHRHKSSDIVPLWLLVIAMIMVLICWFGVNYLAVAGNSVHTYTN
jgi:ABC-type transport system involved in cytochrome c biogenesis permease subunit